ncbi:diphthamide biosynthesis enzyme Dph2 [Candidatus Bathyarchaeota archaeon]|nr:diphthamide biosynthesis enzyme Dph2 [Candidatus Bathyarchaeota archaeon]
MFNFEEDRLVSELMKRKAKKVLIQFPEGLKTEAFALSRLIESKTGAIVFVSADSCYGGCDLALDEALRLNVHLIVHYGHTPYLKHTPIPVLYLEARATEDVQAAVKASIPLLKNFARIGLATTAQHVHQLTEARKILEEAKKLVVIGPAKGRIKYDGQVLGCDFTTVKSISSQVDAIVFVGGGDFHPLGIALNTGKPVVAADPYTNKAKAIDDLKRKILRQRWATISKAREMKNFGVLLGVKVGQKNYREATSIKNQLLKAGKEAVILSVREITPEILMAFKDIEAFVDTACPRVAIDDAARFQKPVLTPEEVKVMLGKIDWGAYAK